MKDEKKQQMSLTVIFLLPQSEPNSTENGKIELFGGWRNKPHETLQEVNSPVRHNFNLNSIFLFTWYMYLGLAVTNYFSPFPLYDIIISHRAW